jgi:hypothetical protein
MSTLWNSLYCPSEDVGAIAHALQDSLLTLGYQPYNPFGIVPGTSYVQTVRLFVAPPVGGWTRVIGAPDDGQLPLLSKIAPCLYVQLDGAEAQMSAFANGAGADVAETFASYLRDDSTADQLSQLLSVPANDEPLPGNVIPFSMYEAPVTQTTLPFTVLPDDVQSLAGKVDKGAAEKMFNRLTGTLMKKVGGDSEGAKALIAGEGAPDWNSNGGQRIQALMNLLTMPGQWREPDFVALRDAYALHERRRRNPNARLYPGDEATMAKVPDALTYLPVYGGRNV